MSLILHQEKLKQALQSGLNSPGDDHRQRQALTAIAIHANKVGVAPLDYIVAQILEQYNSLLVKPSGGISIMPLESPTSQLQTEISCRKCGKPFRSQTALNGHGEARCKGNLSQTIRTEPMT